MPLKDYFRGRSGRRFWLNVLAAVLVLVALIVGAFASIDAFTRHGRVAQVPDVGQLSWEQARRALRREGLKMVVEDSLYDPHSLPGVVLEQRPAAGSYVKPGRRVAVVLNRAGAAPVALPDLAGNATLRLAEQQLRGLGFRMGTPVYVDDEPLDLVLAIRQDGRLLRAGEMVSPASPLVLEVGAGPREAPDSLALEMGDSLALPDEGDMDADTDFGFDE